jgi:tagaturonate reductase
MRTDIAPAIPYNVTTAETDDFTSKVLDRFRNPNIEHQWISISAQYSSKIKMRVLPLLLNHYKTSAEVPEFIALGFAAFIRFMKVTKIDGKFVGHINGSDYMVTDSQTEYFYNAWTNADTNKVTDDVLSNKILWDTDLTALPGLAASVAKYLSAVVEQGTLKIIENIESNSVTK